MYVGRRLLGSTQHIVRIRIRISLIDDSNIIDDDDDVEEEEDDDRIIGFVVKSSLRKCR